MYLFPVANNRCQRTGIWQWIYIPLIRHQDISGDPKKSRRSVPHMTGKFVDGPWSQPTPDSMTRDIACQARDARTVELDSGTKDPSAAWFDGMWAASFRLEKRV
jgi:hypothetical protein